MQSPSLSLALQPSFIVGVFSSGLFDGQVGERGSAHVQALEGTGDLNEQSLFGPAGELNGFLSATIGFSPRVDLKVRS
jgi:hypothetical protein